MNSKKSIKNVWTAEKSKTELAHAEFDSAPGRAQNLLSSIFPAMGLGHLRFLFQQRQGQAPPMKSVDVATEQPYPFVLLPIGALYTGLCIKSLLVLHSLTDRLWPEAVIGNARN